jgi:hypothetical protein
MSAVPLLILDDLGMRKLPSTAAEDLLELIMRRYERTSTLLTSNRPVDDWGKLLATPPPSPPCSTGSSTTPTCSSADPRAGAPSSRPPLPCRRPARIAKRSPSRARRMAGFDPSTHGRFSDVHRGTYFHRLVPVPLDRCARAARRRRARSHDRRDAFRPRGDRGIDLSRAIASRAGHGMGRRARFATRVGASRCRAL